VYKRQPIITALAASAIAVLQLALMMNVGLYRGKVGIGIGYGKDERLARKVRMHGNLAENSALFLVLLFLAESLADRPGVVAALAGLFVFARIAHAVGPAQSSGRTVARGLGALGTLLGIGGAAGLIVGRIFAG